MGRDFQAFTLILSQEFSTTYLPKLTPNETSKHNEHFFFWQVNLKCHFPLMGIARPLCQVE